MKWFLGAPVALFCLSAGHWGAVAAQEEVDDLVSLVYSTVEQLKVENLVLQQQLVESARALAECRAGTGVAEYRNNLRAISDSTNALRLELEAAHPGTRWAPETPETPFALIAPEP